MISDGLDADQADHRRQQPERLAGQLAKIDVHADGEEEHAEQQALEGLDGGLDGLAELGLRQQQAGNEGAERHRQAGQRRQRRRCRRSRTGSRPRTARWCRSAATRRNSGRSSSRPTMTISAERERGLGQRQARCRRRPSRPRRCRGWRRTAGSAPPPGPAPAGWRSWRGRRSWTAGAGWRAPR